MKNDAVSNWGFSGYITVLPKDVCLKVFVSGQCHAPDNHANKLHVCKLLGPHSGAIHVCACGKEWTDVAVLTDRQYAEVAYTKAVE